MPPTWRCSHLSTRRDLRVAKTSVSLVMSALTLTGVLAIGAAPETYAEDCKGVSERTHVTDDFDHHMAWYDVKMDSCATAEYLEKLNGPSDTATMVSLASNLIPGIGAVADYLGVWTMQNRHALEECAKPGTGVTFHEVNNAIIDCKPQ